MEKIKEVSSRISYWTLNEKAINKTLYPSIILCRVKFLLKNGTTKSRYLNACHFEDNDLVKFFEDLIAENDDALFKKALPCGNKITGEVFRIEDISAVFVKFVAAWGYRIRRNRK